MKLFKRVPTYWARIYVAGSMPVIQQACREYCYRGATDPALGFCVNVQPCDFIYTGAEEHGAIVELVNYPRFPAEQAVILEKAQELAEILRVQCCQWCVMIVTPEETIWYSSRD